MFTQSLIAFVALAGYIATPVLAVPGASWVRRQEDAQTSRTLDPAVISEGLKQDGQGNNPDPGQVRSATSVNNFINHCLIALDQGVPLTNGKQIATGSCSQTPMGRIVSLDQSPRSKFVFPKNGDESLVENQAFTVQMKILNLVTGNFVNAQSNYYSAPQQVNDQGILVGHSHVTIQAIPDLQTTEPVDPTRFSFFKGFNDAAQNDILTATVTNGLPAGVYRMCSINTAANHQVALVSNAQHGALEDCSYFTVKAAGQANNNNNNNNNASTSASNSNTATATVSQSASVSATATQSESASASATKSASASNGANESSSSAANESSTDANSSTNVPTATESAAPEQSSPAQESNNASQGQPSETFSESSPAPEPTDNGNNNNNGNNGNNNGNGDQGQNNGNTNGNNNNNGNNGGNNGNQGNNDQNGNNGSNDNNNNNNNNQGNNDQNNGNNGDSSSAAPAPTENTGAQDPAASPSANSSSEAPAPEATPAPENGNGDNQNNGGNGAQTPGADTNVPQDPAAGNTNN